MNTKMITGPVDEGGENSTDHDAGPQHPPNARDSPTGGPQDAQSQRSRKRAKAKTRRPHHIPDRDAILVMLNKLVPLIITGALPPAQANTVHAMMRTLLHELRNDSRPASSTGANIPRLQEMLRENPDLLDAVAPILSPDDLRALVEDDLDDSADPNVGK